MFDCLEAEYEYCGIAVLLSDEGVTKKPNVCAVTNLMRKPAFVSVTWREEFGDGAFHSVISVAPCLHRAPNP